MNKYFKYLWYVLKHKWYVFVECCKMGCIWRGITHDLSKFRLSEFVPYARYFYGQSKNDSVNTAFDFAWLHHQHRNKHHYQYYILREDDGGKKIMEMPRAYMIEMLCDWRGAGRAITGKDNIKTWYKDNKDKMLLHNKTRALVETQIYGYGGLRLWKKS